MVEASALRMKSKHPLVAKFRFASNTGDASAPNRIVLPAPGTPSDPRMNGGGVIVTNPALPFDRATHYLAPFNWKPIGPAQAPRGYKYSGKHGGDGWIRSVTIRADEIRVKGLVNYSLDEPSQGQIAVRVYTGFTHWCAEAAAKTGNPPSSTKFDQAGKFIGQPKSPAPAACAPLP
jgi:hypothetical protein